MWEENETEISEALKSIASSITAPAAPGHDATGGLVASLTEAVMGLTTALCKIAEAGHDIANAIRERGEV